MLNSKAILVTAAFGLAIGGASSALARSDAQTNSDKAQYELAQGNYWLATNLQKRVVAEAPTVVNRFNLATAYQQTGRLNTAKSYYQALATEGEGVGMEQGWRSRNFDVGMTSADRLLYIDWLQNGATRRGGAVAATEAASNVSATVGGAGNGDAEVTDEQARALDRQARAAIR
ncbi:hypothetical protein [Caulobacter sp. RL271]|jgi:hypothetical protein|uniref:Uncharacterized protein n=1 Tax=Caulobacter segnis TaxID=88688 RepID=A0ABY4ZQT1_9CAUL|nr:hypothetical protein [Caulobacter segnis]USQ94749.1 hypothetical protein MZV50_19555 [Caulobacter segnis]